jgi:hypothetical protein
MRRSVGWCSGLIQGECGPLRYKPALLTLTYRDVDGYEPRHISELLKRIRHWLKHRRCRLRYVWVAELQQRSALHYHVVIWLPRGLTLPLPDKQGWWPHGLTRIEWARKPVAYLLKYTSKFDTKQELPYGVRLHGAGGLDRGASEIRRWLNLPAWLKSIAGVQSSFMRIKGLGLVERGTGVWVQSPWRVSCKAGKVTATKMFDYLRAIANVGGPYSMLDGNVAV